MEIMLFNKFNHNRYIDYLFINAVDIYFDLCIFWLSPWWNICKCD